MWQNVSVFSAITVDVGKVSEERKAFGCEVQEKKYHLALCLTHFLKLVKGRMIA